MQDRSKGEITPVGRQATSAWAQVPKYQRAPPPPRKSTRPVHLALTILILGFAVLYAQRNGSKRSKTLYGAAGKDLPDYYAICSKDGAGVYTVPVAGGSGATECVVVGGKEVLDSGSLNRIRRRWGDKRTIGAVDGSLEAVRAAGGLDILYLTAGHTLTPGLIDAHGHVLEYGHYLQLPLAGSSSVSEIVDRVESFVTTNGSTLPEGAWIEGMGWNQNLWPGKAFPTAADLESSALLKGKKISLARIDVHAEWVSQAIIDELEAQPGGLPDQVDGGLIVRDAYGKPTGIFIDNAMDLINAIRPPWTDRQRHSFLHRMASDGLAKGLTGVHNARTPKADADLYVKMAKDGSLPIRFNLMVSCGNNYDYCGDRFERKTEGADGRLTIQSVKLFADGALGSRGAALLEDYSDQEGWRGLMLMEEGKWEGVIRKWYDEGWQVNIHTIGDRANHVILDVIEGIAKERGVHAIKGRFRLEHAQIMTVPDIKRAAELGVIGSYQPTHATSDMWYAEDRLGQERIKGAYAWQSYLRHGGKIALGSDFPVESLDPLKGFYAAVTRLSESGESPSGPGGWMPDEKLTREQALRGFTVDAGHEISVKVQRREYVFIEEAELSLQHVCTAINCENIHYVTGRQAGSLNTTNSAWKGTAKAAHAGMSSMTGSLEPGKRFDAVIWDDDLMKVPESEMLEVRVKATILDGKIVHGSLEA